MDEKIIEKLNSLLSKGKISEEEYEELKNLIFDKNSEKVLGIDISNIEIKDAISENIEIIGEKGGIVKVLKGGENLFFETEGAFLRITLKNKRFAKKNLLNIFKEGKEQIVLSVPEHCKIDVKTVSGDFSISNVSGEISIRTISGNVKCENIDGKVIANTVSGDMEMVNFNGELDIKAKAGNIHLSDCNTGGFIKTYSGDVHIENSTIANLNAVIYSGDLSVKKSYIEGAFYAQSMLGDIRFEDTKGDYELLAETKFGEIGLLCGDLHATVQNEFIICGNGKIESEEKLVSGGKALVKLGDIPVNLKTKKGNISIKIHKEV